MDRKALLIYLKDLRDLELAKIKLSSIIQKEKYETENYLKRLITPDIQSIPERDYSWIGSVIGGIFVLILSISCFFSSYDQSRHRTTTISYMENNNIVIKTVPREGVDFFIKIFNIGGFIFLIIFICLILKAWYIIRENNNSIQYARYANEKEQRRTRENKDLYEKEKRKWQERKSYLNKQYNRIQELLNNNYGMNILATPYRNIQSVYYIYDYMSTSQEDLKETLMHERMENGIQRILQKLDIIIEQNSNIIFNQRKSEANNIQLINQNKNILNQLSNIRDNVEESTKYLEMSANYAETCAFFEHAAWLRNS